MYALSGTGTSPSITSTYEFSSGVNSGSSASAIPDSVNITASSNKIRIPVSAVKALPSSSSSPGSPSGQSSSSHVFKPTSATTSSSGRDRGVIRTTLSSASTSTTGGGSQGRRKASPGKTTQQQQQQQHQQQQPKDRQSFHATLIDLFARDKKSLLCPKCHQEGNIHRDGISATAASVGKRRKCNKHFYERAIHTMLIEVVRRQHGALAVVGGISMAAEASDLEGGFCTDMSSASPEITPWHHPLLAGGSAF
ncbi:hypothetical protein BKA57DRAFT_191850 [Linnemannia elongata]|nr:hypothetical protein BKA57DRAFT_191850 [Linnemannia elongata]